MPTATHMAFVKLQQVSVFTVSLSLTDCVYWLQEGILKCVVSQNTDGLHRRSGLPRIGEYHGKRMITW